MQKIPLNICTLLVFVAMASGGNVEGVPAPVSLSTLSITALNAPLPVGTTQKLTAIVTYSDHTTRDVTARATWTSDGSQVVAVTQPGRTTALRPGTAKVFAAFTAFGKTANASIAVQVTAAPIWPATIESAILQRELFMTSQYGSHGTLTEKTMHTVRSKAPGPNGGYLRRRTTSTPQQ